MKLLVCLHFTMEHLSLYDIRGVPVPPEYTDPYFSKAVNHIKSVILMRTGYVTGLFVNKAPSPLQEFRQNSMVAQFDSVLRYVHIWKDEYLGLSQKW